MQNQALREPAAPVLRQRPEDGPRVAHVIFRLGIGGMENGLVNLINHTPVGRARHDIICLTEADADFRQRITAEGVGVYELHKRPGKDPAVYWRLYQLLRRLRPDVLHTRNIGTLDVQVPGWGAGVGRRLHGLHGWHADDPNGTNGKYRLLMRAITPLVDHYVCVSQDLAAWLRHCTGVPEHRVSHICNGVDAERFQPTPHGRTPLPCPGFAGPDDIVLGTVGRLDPIKDQGRLIEALAQLTHELPATGLRLVIVGDGPRREALAAQAEHLGVQNRVWFAGARNDIPSLLQGFDLFVLPSLNEGISNTVLEAMATGLPVVATAVGGNPELIEDGVNGRLVPSADTGALTDALRSYVQDPLRRQQHGRVAREQILRRFSIPVMVERYLSLYEADQTECAR
jgi:sugar transferase (PEP-CTERM/EpsH1 system associated)